MKENRIKTPPKTENEKVNKEENIADPTESTLTKGGEKVVARTLDFEGPDTIEEEAAESDTSQEKRMKTEQRRKTKAINSGRSEPSKKAGDKGGARASQQEDISGAKDDDEEKRLAAERKIKGKEPTKPALRKSARQANKHMSIREPPLVDYLFDFGCGWMYILSMIQFPRVLAEEFFTSF